MPVTARKNHAKVKRMTHAQVARGQNKAMNFLVREAKAMAPVGATGMLKRLIRRRLIATTERPRASAESAAPYSTFVNSGTYKMAARPFWTVALLRTYERFGEFFK